MPSVSLVNDVTAQRSGTPADAAAELNHLTMPVNNGDAEVEVRVKTETEVSN